MTDPTPGAMARAVALSAGVQGQHIKTGTSAVTGEFVEIAVIEAATFTTLTMPDNTGDAGTGFAYPAGFVIKGRITAFTLSAGKVIAQKGTL